MLAPNLNYALEICNVLLVCYRGIFSKHFSSSNKSLGAILVEYRPSTQSRCTDLLLSVRAVKASHCYYNSATRKSTKDPFKGNFTKQNLRA